MWMFLMFCLQMCVTTSNRDISKNKICVFVLVNNFVNIQNQDVKNLHVRYTTGEQNNIRSLKNIINSWIVSLSGKSPNAPQQSPLPNNVKLT